MNYGLVCISELLKEQDKKNAFQSMTRKRFTSLNRSEALSILQSKIIHNIELTIKIIKHCAANKIYHYRISSSIFPLITDPVSNVSFEDLPEYKNICTLCSKVGATAQEYGVSLSLHPDQYNVLASKNEKVVEKTIKELDFLSFVFDLMNLPLDYSAPINIHPGCNADSDSEKDFRDFIDRFYDGFLRCSYSLRSRLVIENEDKGTWSCSKVFSYFYNFCGSKHGHPFPLTYDNLHDYCNPSYINEAKVSMLDNIKAFEMTWKPEYTPVFHWSWGKCGAKNHDDYAPEPPPAYDRLIKWEVELKAKDKAILKLINPSKPTCIKEEKKSETFNFLYKR